MHLIEPTQAALIPRPFRQPLSPAFYPKGIPLSAPDSASDFEGYIIVRPDLNQFCEISITDPNDSSVSAGKVYSEAKSIPKEDPQVARYSIPNVWTDTDGNRVAETTMVQVKGSLADAFFALDTITGRWIQGSAWVVIGDIATSTNATLADMVFSPGSGVNVPAGAAALTFAYFNSDYSSLSVQQAVTLVTGTNSYALADFSAHAAAPICIHFNVIQPLTGDYKMGFAVNALDYTLSVNQDQVLPIGPVGDYIYDGILNEATQYSVPRFSARMQYTGSTSYDAGNISAALVPAGTKLPFNSVTALMAALDALPYHNHKGRASQGAHVCYFPARTQDVFLRETGEEIKGNFIVIAWSCPATGSAGQKASFKLHLNPAPEWLVDTNTLPQLLPPWDRDLIDTIFSFLGEYNPAGENPDHIAKIKSIARRIASNPAVQDAAKVAWTVAKQGAKVAVPALLAML